MKFFTFFFLLLLSVTGYSQLSLPMDFETTPVTSDFIDFDGGTGTVIPNPQSIDPNTSVNVAQIVRDGGQVWAGSKLVLADNLDFSTLGGISMKVFSPAAGITVKFKLEGTAETEVDVLTTVANQWETLTWNFTGQPSGTFNTLVFMFDFGNTGDGTANSTFLFDDIEQVDVSGGLSQIDLPVTFEDANVDYTLTDFGGNASTVVVDPTDPNNTVAQSIKTGTAETWAGTTIGTDFGFANAIPITASETKMTVRVWSPDAGIPIRLKIEDHTDPTKSVETETNTTVAMAWETLEFDFNNEAPGTAALNLSYTYDKASIFFNFGTDGMTAGEKTYYWDDVEFVSSSLDQVDLPITFEDANVDYNLTDFGGNASSIVVDPTDPNNMVGQAIKTGTAETWAGTTMGDNGLANAIPFTASETKITVRVWSPDAGIPIRLKAEDASNNTITVETETNTTVAMAWETLEFDFSNEAPGTAALNLANTYDKVSIFFNFGTDGATAGEKTYYWDDVEFVPTTAFTVYDIIANSPDHETLETAINAAGLVGDLSGDGPLTIFAPTDAAFAALPPGVLDALLADPTCALAQVLVHHAVSDLIMSADLSDGQMITNIHGLDLTVTIDGNNNVFIDGAQVTTADLVADNGVVHVIDAVLTFDFIDLPVTFEDPDVFYNLVDFGGNVSSTVTDPTDPNNMVGQAIKTGSAETWAGTTMGNCGLANAIPFTASETKMKVRVWSPDADTPIRLKVEHPTNNLVTVETETNTTVAMAWETLEFDFSNEVPGTPGLHLSSTYDKVSIFFNFGTDGMTAGEKTYYWDDVEFGGLVGIEVLNAANYNIKVAPNPANAYFYIEFPEALNEEVLITLFDVSGRLLKQERIQEQWSEVNTSDLNAGTYFLRIDTKEASYYQKVMIAK